MKLKLVKSAFGGEKKIIVDESGTQYSLNEVFDAYLRFGGMPGIADVGLEQDRAFTLLDGIYSTVVIRDILEREKGERGVSAESFHALFAHHPKP